MKFSRLLCTTAVAIPIATVAQAIVYDPLTPESTSEYILIATGDDGVGNALDLSNSEIGAISAESGSLRFNSVSPPSDSNDGFNGFQGPSTGVITLDGDAILTDTSGTLHLSNADVHAETGGPGSEGMQGIDCAGSYNSCTDSGDDISTGGPLGPNQDGSGFNTTGLPGGPAFSQVANNNGVQGGVSPTDVLDSYNRQLAGYTTTNGNTFDGYGSYGSGADVTLNFNSFAGYSDSTITVTGSASGGTVESNLFFSLTSGLTIVDINTGNNDLSLPTLDWVVDGAADSFVVFRIQDGNALLSSNGNFLLGNSGIGTENILFLVDYTSTSFGLYNTEFYGYSFWDVNGSGQVVLSDSRGCGQIKADKINLQNASMTGCAFNYIPPDPDPTPDNNTPPPPVPVPGSLPLLLTGIAAAGAYRARRRK